MAGSSVPGSQCRVAPSATWLHDGTSALMMTPIPGPQAAQSTADFWSLQRAIDQLQVAANQFAAHAIHENSVRQGYLREIRQMSRQMLDEVRGGLVTARKGAETANILRNEILEATRLRSTRVGQAWAISLKKEGKTLAELLDHYAVKAYGRSFAELGREAERNAVYLEVVKAAGRDRGPIAPMLSKAARIGRGLAIVSLGYAVYEVYTADDKVRAAGHEAASFGAGAVGGMAGGAAASLVCGPGAPVCFAAFVLAGGALAAWGGGVTFDWLTGGR